MKTLAALFVCAVLAHATSKEDQARIDQLTAQVAAAQTEAARAVAENKAALEKLAEQNRQEAVVATHRAAVAAGERSSQKADAASAALSAQDSAAQAHSDQEQGHLNAEDQLEAARRQLDATRDQNADLRAAAATAKWNAYTTIGGQAFAFLAVMAGLFATWLKLKEVHSVAIESKAEAHAAYVEANTVNMKIASVGLRLADGSKAHEASNSKA